MKEYRRSGRALAAIIVAVFATVAFAQDPTPEDRQNRLPDPAKTPGHATYHTAATICALKSTKDERNVPAAEKRAVYEAYDAAICQSFCSGPQGCEIDHLISLELGGANTSDNLWPQPYDGDWNAHDKDRLENKLHRMVCNKSISLTDAQHEIATDWIEAYKKYVGERKPFKPQVRCH